MFDKLWDRCARYFGYVPVEQLVAADFEFEKLYEDHRDLIADTAGMPALLHLAKNLGINGIRSELDFEAGIDKLAVDVVPGTPAKVIDALVDIGIDVTIPFNAAPELFPQPIDVGADGDWAGVPTPTAAEDMTSDITAGTSVTEDSATIELANGVEDEEDLTPDKQTDFSYLSKEPKGFA